MTGKPDDWFDQNPFEHTLIKPRLGQPAAGKPTQAPPAVLPNSPASRRSAPTCSTARGQRPITACTAEGYVGRQEVSSAGDPCPKPRSWQQHTLKPQRRVPRKPTGLPAQTRQRSRSRRRLAGAAASGPCTCQGRGSNSGCLDQLREGKPDGSQFILQARLLQARVPARERAATISVDSSKVK